MLDWVLNTPLHNIMEAPRTDDTYFKHDEIRSFRKSFNRISSSVLRSVIHYQVRNQKFFWAGEVS